MSLVYRILRAVKNRYGSTNEIGVFKMGSQGLSEVINPSALMLMGRAKGASGTCVACMLEGTRPILIEVQALVTRTGFGLPRRISTGFEYNRMCLIIAILEKRIGLSFSSMDSYINIVGGFDLSEPAADLPVALALVSALKNIALPDGLVAFGELGLSGEVRSIRNAEQRVDESKRLGFDCCMMPTINVHEKNISIGVDSIKDAVNLLFGTRLSP
ncbi:MAG: hypothetical protein LBP36_02865 [Oscillospiraceae bacterium]|nr:hypothetical protein [Oscillospiraceae bacterium]